MVSSSSTLIQFEGHEDFRLRLTLATLAGKSMKISRIRSDDISPGLKDYEVSFLRLLEAVTNGSKIEISYTGTTVLYHPGIIIGGDITHNCPSTKPIGYFLEMMMYLAPFSKKKFSIVFKGLTASNKGNDAGVDSLKWGLLPIMEKFGVRDASIHILKRGSPPGGGGEIHFVCNSLLIQPLTIHALTPAKFSAIRGIAYCTRVSPSTVNRIIDAARKVLKPTQIEVNITADVWRGENSGKSPGFGVTLVAELKKGWCIASEGVGASAELPEDLGEIVSYHLLEELSRSSVFGRNQISLILSYMALGKEDIGRIRLHKSQIDERFVSILRDLKSIFGATAYLKEADGFDSDEKDTISLSMKGIGFTNASKKIV